MFALIALLFLKSARNLALIKPPFSDGRVLLNPEHLTDGNPNTYAEQWSPGRHSIKWSYRGRYNISCFIFKLETGVTYPYIDLSVSNDSVASFKSVFQVDDYVQGPDDKAIFFAPVANCSHVKFTIGAGTGKGAKIYKVEIWGTGPEAYEGPSLYNGTRSDTKYTKLVWNDEFDGDKLDMSKWTYINNVHFTHHMFSNQSFSIKKDGKNSYLAIRAANYSTYENLTSHFGEVDLFPNYNVLNKKDCIWVAGRVDSRDKFSFKFGRVVIRAKCALTRGHWPALWMLSQDERGHDEIDILEAPHFDDTQPFRSWGTNHFGKWHIDHGSEGRAIPVYESLSENFHIFETEWDLDSIRFYLDGELCFTTTKGKEIDGMHNRAMYLILDTHLSRGGASGWAGATYWDLSEQDHQFLIDWVRVYQTEKHEKTFCDPLSTLDLDLNNGYVISPHKISGAENFVLLTEGKEQFEDRHNFYYHNGMPFDERTRVAKKEGKKDQFLVWHLENMKDFHASVYYQTVPDIIVYAPQDKEPMGVSILDKLVAGSPDMYFKLYTSATGTDDSWKEFTMNKLPNLVHPYPVYSRITYDAYNLPEGTSYVKFVFPNYEGAQYQCGNGTIVNVKNTDIQVSKVVFQQHPI